MKPVMFCRKTSGMPRELHSSMKVRALERALGEQDAVVGQDSDRVPVDVGEAAHQRLAVERLELVHPGPVHDAG
jgi:hypothetical protein